jgi:hypothetical protein
LLILNLWTNFALMSSKLVRFLSRLWTQKLTINLYFVVYSTCLSYLTLFSEMKWKHTPYVRSVWTAGRIKDRKIV